LTIYVCDKCGFCFERTGAVDSCPDCGRGSVRDADAGEIQEYKRIRAELAAQDDKRGKPE